MRINRLLAQALAVFVVLATPAGASVLKIATIAPEGSEWMLEHRDAAVKIKEQTEGRVIVKFYGGGVMGNDRKVLRKIRIGQLQGAAFSASGLAEKYPDIVLYGLPWVFYSQDEIDYVRTRFDSGLMAGLREAGFVSFGFAGGGFAYFMSNQPLRNREDLKGKKIWVPAGDENSYAALELQKLSPVVLPLSDVLTALQTGLLDVIVTPPSAALLLQWYTKLDYISTEPVAYTLGLLALDARAFERLSEADREVVSTVFTETYQRLDQINRTDNEEAEEALLANGIKMVDVEKDDIPYWRSIADEANQKIWEKDAVDPDLYNQLKKALQEYRDTGVQSEPVANASE
jgi:TRAP-type C4-dicarboxylate transport system substrate-binding protein